MLKGVYFITDSKFGKHEDLAKKALDLGVKLIQLREKKMKDRELFLTAKKLRELTESYDALLMINDRLDIAISAEADGVHLGQEDLPLEIAREIFDGLIGISVHSVEEAKKARKADYLGAGPIFKTTTKEDAKEPIGLEELRKIISATNLPVFAIGGISLENVKSVLDCKVSGVAVVSAIAGESAERAKDFIELVNKYLRI
ncbi:MAG: thiamine phosphate synthase [Archaeoglobaceae archaeon]|nr:thiamine phosphate synthase [Archaeoglobaceae archaeon]MDW8127935.1 thiamine phosphate synthase [Archaeoglobaceae archaeon]